MQTAFSLCADMASRAAWPKFLSRRLFVSWQKKTSIPPTTEEQAPPEMPGKAPEMEQAEIPDVGGGPAPSAR